jgi:hypothetical protein
VNPGEERRRPDDRPDGDPVEHSGENAIIASLDRSRVAERAVGDQPEDAEAEQRPGQEQERISDRGWAMRVHQRPRLSSRR